MNRYTCTAKTATISYGEVHSIFTYIFSFISMYSLAHFIKVELAHHGGLGSRYGLVNICVLDENVLAVEMYI